MKTTAPMLVGQHAQIQWLKKRNACADIGSVQNTPTKARFSFYADILIGQLRHFLGGDGDRKCG